MIFRSVPLMTIFDVIIIGFAVVALWTFYQHRHLFKQLHVDKALSLIAGGLIVIALYFAADLSAMLVLPVVTDQTYAMTIMTDMHLNLNFPVNAIAVGCIVGGISRLTQILVPRIACTIGELEHAQEHLERNIAQRQQLEETLKQEHDVLEQRMAERTAALQAPPEQRRVALLA